MMYYLVKYEFEVTTKTGGKVKLGCLEIMDENRRHYAMNYIDDMEIYSVKADVGDDTWEEVWVNVDEVYDAIEGAMAGGYDHDEDDLITNWGDNNYDI